MYLRGLINVLRIVCFPSHQDRSLVETVCEGVWLVRWLFVVFQGLFFITCWMIQFWSLNHLELSFNGAKLPFLSDLAPDLLSPNGAVTFHLHSSECPVERFKVLC